MTYTFTGNKDYIDKEISQMKKKYDAENMAFYDLEESSIDRVIEDLNTISLFGEKFVEVHNFDKTDNPEVLIKYLENESDNTLVLVSFKELDNRKKLTKVLKEKTEFKELFNYDLIKFIKTSLEDYKMNNMAINVLINYCSSDIKRIESELEKLKLYKYNEKEITSDDIDKIVVKSYDSTIFNLIDAINLRDKEKIYKIYYELLEEGESEDKIMYTIANHYRLLYQIKEKLKTKSKEEIMSEYRMKPYRLTKLKEQSALVEKEFILKMLKGLSEVDIRFKSGDMELSVGMFKFLESL